MAQLPPLPSDPTIKTKTIILGGSSISGELAPGTEDWYTFKTISNKIFFALLYEPTKRVSADQIQISFDREQSDKPGGIGVGSTIPGRAGLILKADGLLSGEQFYLRVLNNASEPIYYCLAPRDVSSWDCR